MGFRFEFNWVLKLKKEQGLPENPMVGEVYDFFKEGTRVYPIGVPIDLVSGKWESVAKIMVIEARQDGLNTIGKFKIIKRFAGIEKEMITYYWRESIEMQLGRKIEDWSDARVS